MRHHLLRHRETYSLELAATRDGGIRYIMAVPPKEKDAIKRSLLSYMPGLKVNEVNDYLPRGTASESITGVTELKFSADFVLPLQDHKTLNEHDTIAYLAGHMTKLAARELVGFQLIVSPIMSSTHPHITRRLSAIRKLISTNQPLAPKLRPRNPSLPLFFLPLFLRLIFTPLFWALKGVGSFAVNLPALLTDDHYHQNKAAQRAALPAAIAADPYEVELAETIKAKTTQHLYEATIRILVSAQDAATVESRTAEMVASLRSFSSPHQSITTRRNIPLLSSPTSRLGGYRSRALSADFIDQNMVLSSSELADLYHFPNSNFTKTEGLVKSRSRELPAPLSLKNGTPFDVIAGASRYGGETLPIGLTLNQRQKHTYVIGKTGMGKTTMLTSMIYQDMDSGKGLAVLDPHGDMFHELLQMVPEHRRQDVVVFDPSDREFPIGLNLLDPGVDFASEDDRQEWITSTVLSVFAKLSDEAFWGPRMEHILRYATLTALQLPNPTLYTLQKLLTNKSFQVETAKTISDPVLKQFWQKEIALLGDMQLATVTAPLTHRLGHFIATKMSRHILLQQKSTVRIADLMNEGKILLVNLSKGNLGEDQSTFFGLMLTSLIWMAAYQRTKIPERDRRDFFVYVDEFQNFATPRFAEITSEGRKFRVSLIASHQNIAQIEDANLLMIVAGNAATIICLKASPSDEDFILPFMQPEVSKGDIVNLAPYQFFMKTSGEASEDAFTGQTTPVNVPKEESVEQAVVAASRARYGVRREVVEKFVEALLSASSKKYAKPASTPPLTSGPNASAADAPKLFDKQNIEA